MPKITIAFGLVLVGLGLIAYFGLSGDTKSVTALIPAFFGLPMVALGIAAGSPKLRKHAIHGALLLALLGVVGTARGVMKLPTLFSDPDSLERPNAVAVQSIMCGLCVVFIALGIWSFVAARRAPAN